MKDRPKPKKELTVIECVSRNIKLIPVSEDAREFLLNEMPNYGSYTYFDHLKSYILKVSPVYDIDEVVEYFESYND